VTIHGTFDCHDLDSGELWWQTGSPFNRRLTDELSKRGMECLIQPFHWSGENSDAARITAADDLWKLLRSLKARKERIIVLAHSHGGNVLLLAMTRSLSLIDYFDSPAPDKIITLGTPFFCRKRTLYGKLNTIGSIAISVFSASVLIALAIIAVLKPAAYHNAIVLSLAFAAFTAAFGIIAPYSFGFKQLITAALMRNKIAKYNTLKAKWLSVFSSKDEALNGLSRVEFFAKERSAGISGRRLFRKTFRSIAALWFCYETVTWFVRPTMYKNSYLEKFVPNGVVDPMILVLGVPYLAMLMYCFYYVASFVFSPLFPVMGFIENHFKNSTLRGIAFGEDDDFVLTKISPVPEEFEVSSYRADFSDLINEKERNDLIQEIFDLSLISQRIEGNLDGWPLLVKRLSATLYHNAYFRNDGIVDLIAGHICTEEPS
jgi:hypothetical protein